MSVLELREKIADHSKDIRLNLGSVLSPEGAPGLSQKQIWQIALSCAYSLKSTPLIEAISADASLSEEEVRAAKSAASIMAMNNVYYRFLHLVEDPEFKKMPARLRMNVIGSPGIPKVDFELNSLAVSAIAGCGSCIQSHVHEVKKAGLSNESVQSSIRIASVINAAALSLQID